MARTVRFDYTGSQQLWTVPSNAVSPITVELAGAGGGSSRGGRGGHVIGALPVTPGLALNLFVAGVGGRANGASGGAGGWNGGGGGGGISGSLQRSSDGGGGATDIRINATTLQARAVVAGGGGGEGRSGGSGADGGVGGSAGSNSGNGENGSKSPGGVNPGSGGYGGTQTAGGAGATDWYGNTPNAGSLGQGGKGADGSGNFQAAGGGGGGGYYGGGSGGNSYNNGQSNTGGGGGGGGGSNYTGGLSSVTQNDSSGAPPGGSGYIIITYAVTPNAPTLTGPADNTTFDRTVPQRFSWTFSDDDPGDSQSKADIRFSSDGGTTWITNTVASPNGFYDAPAGSLAAASWQWQVRVYDSLGNVGPWSASRFFTAATPANGPTITYPTSGGTVQQNDRVDWSLSAAQQSYQVQRLADSSDGTAPDTNTIYFDTGEITSDAGVTTRSLALNFATNNRYEWIRVRCRSGGLLTAWTAVRVQVSYTPPPAAAATVTVDDVADTITVSWTTAAATGTQPVPTSARVLRTIADAAGTVIVATGPLATAGTWTFRTPASGASYSFAVRTYADNGQTTDSGWVT